jgi:hypothetical protein
VKLHGLANFGSTARATQICWAESGGREPLSPPRIVGARLAPLKLAI